MRGGGDGGLGLGLGFIDWLLAGGLFEGLL